MSKYIFYGAGNNAKKNMEGWIKEGWIPECIVDRVEEKWGGYWDTSAGRIEVISLDKANRLYPKAEIKITLARKNLKEATEYLLEQGIEKERISYFEPVEYRRGCQWLGRCYIIQNCVTTCCTPSLYGGIPLSDDAELNYSNYLEFCDRLSNEIKRNEGQCSSCPNLKFDIFEKEQFINEINISSKTGYDICNAKCSYCSGFKAESQDNLEKRKAEVINTLKFFETHFPKRNFTVAVASGEIAVEPYEDELFDIIDKNGWNATIMTNGSIYSERVAKALLNSKSSALITLDSTVPEVYSKIKGINCLDKVLKNICEYNKYGRVNVKWIALEQTYTSFEQIKGIVDFVSDNNIDLCISHDSYSIDKVMSEELKDLTYKFICYAMDKAVKFNIIYDHFHREDSEHLKLFVKNMKKGCE